MEVEACDYFEMQKISEKTFNPLKVRYYNYEHNSWIVLFNKFILIVKHGESFETLISHHNDFHIKEMYLTQNVFLCQDCDNNLHFNVLRSNVNDPVILKNLKFKKFLKNVHSVWLEEDQVYVLAVTETSTTLYSYSIIGQVKLKLGKIFSIDVSALFDSPLNIFNSNFSFSVKPVSYFSSTFLRKVLNVSTLPNDCQVFYFTRNNSIYWCFLSDESIIIPKILYSCLISIQSFHFDDRLCSILYIALETGNILIISYDYQHETVNQNTIHLNSSINKCIIGPSWILYTDCYKLWQTNFNTADKNMIVASKYKIENIYDITYDNKKDIFYCTNIYNNFYVFSLKSKCFEKKNKYDTFFQIPKTMKECDKVSKEILKETDKNQCLLKYMKREDIFITALALKRNSTLVSKHFLFDVKIYEDMSEININITEKSHIITEKSIYYENDSKICMVIINFSKELKEKFSEMIKIESNMWHIWLKLHSDLFNISSCIPIKSMESFTVLMPFKSDTPFLSLNANLIGLIPDVNSNQHLYWTIVSTKQINIDPLYFLKLQRNELLGKRKLVNHENKKSLNEKIHEIKSEYDVAKNEIIQTKKNNPCIEILYVKLPNNFSQITQNFAEVFCQNCVSPENIAIEITNLNFVNLGRVAKFSICSNFVELTISKLENNLLRLKISSSNRALLKSFYQHVLETLLFLRDDDNSTVFMDYYDCVVLKYFKEKLQTLTESEEISDIEALRKINEEFKRDIIGKIPI